MFRDLRENRNIQSIILNMLIAAVSLFVNGFGVYLTIQANLGAAPWDVLNLGISRSLHILYGNASIAVSLTILVIDILLKEPIGIAMFIDAVVVGKAVDYFNWVHAVPACDSLVTGIPVMFAGLVILAYTQYTYMIASLGCGPRDTLLVGLAKRVKKLPIGAVSIALLSTATLIGWLLGGPVGVGTLICAFATGPVMQMAFRTVHFDATSVKHQRLRDSVKTDVELIIDVDPRIPSTMRSDVAKLKKIIRHLIDNALKYTDEGGVYVHFTPEEREYGINLLIEVTDTGIGMTDVELEKVFERFYQADSGRARAANGLGLGLSIVKGFTRSLNGFLKIDSEPQVGTTVRVSIPQKVVGNEYCMSIQDPGRLSSEPISILKNTEILMSGNSTMPWLKTWCWDLK